MPPSCEVLSEYSLAFMGNAFCIYSRHALHAKYGSVIDTSLCNCMQQADNTTVWEGPGPHDVSVAAASFGDSQDWMPFVGFSVCNFLSLLTSVFSLLLLLSLHLMQYSTVFHAHKIDDPKEQEHRDLLTFSLVSAALGTLIFSILCLLLAAHFAIMISFCRYNRSTVWRLSIPLGSLLTLVLFVALLLFCTKFLLARVFSRYRNDIKTGLSNLRTNFRGGKANTPRPSA